MSDTTPPPLVRLTEFESAVLARARAAGVRPEIGSEPIDTKGNWRAVIRNLMGDAPTRDQVVAQHLESFLANYSPPPE